MDTGKFSLSGLAVALLAEQLAKEVLDSPNIFSSTHVKNGILGGAAFTARASANTRLCAYDVSGQQGKQQKKPAALISKYFKETSDESFLRTDMKKCSQHFVLCVGTLDNEKNIKKAMGVATLIVPTGKWKKDTQIVDWLVVDERHRRKRLGTALLNCVMIIGHTVQE